MLDQVIEADQWWRGRRREIVLEVSLKQRSPAVFSD